MSDDVETLRDENAHYHQQMQELNEEMDRMLLKRDKPGKKKEEERRDERPYELRQLLAKNEQLRKERLKWWAECTHSDTAIRIADTKNEISVVDKKILTIKEEIRGLSNIRKNQQHVVDVAKHANEELRFLQAQHRQEVQEFREQLRVLAEENKESEKSLSYQQARYHGAQEKLKLGLNGDEVNELKETVDEQGTEIEALKQELESRTESARGKRKEGHKESDKYTREKKRLEKELETVKQTLLERERELKLSYARGKLVGGGSAPQSPRSAAA